MNRSKKYLAIIVAVVIGASVPTFAASTNKVSEFVTVEEEATLEGVLAPSFKLDLEDGLVKGETFYLQLENANWVKDIEEKLEDNKDFTFARMSATELRVRANKDIRPNRVTLEIPLYVVVTGGEAVVKVESNDIAITSGEYAFAVTEGTKGKVTVKNLKGFAQLGELSTITIEEPYIGAFNSDKAQFLKLELKSKGIELNHNPDDIIKDALVGKKSFRDEKFSAVVVDATTIEVEIPAKSLDARQRGELELSGVKVKSVAGAPYGPVNVAIKGDLVEDTTLVAGNHSDYGTEVTVAKDYTVVAGQKLKDVEFTLAEIVPKSLQGNRETDFVFPEGVIIDTVEISDSKGLSKDEKLPEITILQEDGKNTNEFRVSSIIGNEDESISMTFKATLDIPTTFSEDIVLLVQGPSIKEDKEIIIAKVESPVAVEIEPARVKVGLANQTGGKITLTETSRRNLSRGSIFFALEESTMKYTKAPIVEVTKGDLKVGEARIVPGGLEVSVTRESSEASELVISGGEVSVDRTVPDGNFYAEVGGPAISAFSSETLWNAIDEKHNDIGAIAKETFLIVGTSDVEEPSEDTNTAIFKIGEVTYTVNEETKTMDTTPYISNSRTMLPVRYVADALGVEESQIAWDSDSKTVTVIADRIIQVKIGSNKMTINDVATAMSAQPEIQNDRIFVPVAEIARALGADVAWDKVNKIATFN